MSAIAESETGGETAPVRRPPAVVVLGSALAGAVAGAATGAVDGLWSWRALTQFTPGAGGKLRVLLYLIAAYGAAGVVAGAAAAVVLLFFARSTRLGDLARFAARAHADARARDPADAVTGLALALVGVPCIGAALAVAYRLAVPVLSARNRPDLVVASAMAIGLGAAAAAVPVTFALARPVELGLRRLARRPGPLGRAVSSPLAPIAAAGALVAIGAAVAAALAWKTVQQLPLRAPIVVAVAVGFAAALAPVALGWADRLALPGPRRRARDAALAAGTALLFALVFVAGNRPAVIKAATAYSGLGGPIARGLRTVGDLDRDHHSRWLGGGDCDDGDATVHPDAFDIPDDGIDQNCVGGDAHEAPAKAPTFAPVPPSVPADFDVVLVTIDTLRADHVGAYGYRRPTTPSLDKVAADGAVFVNAWAHAPSTRYSMPAILTGRLPLDVYYDTSVQGWPGILPRATTIAEVLHDRGLQTGGILNYWYFDPSRHMNQGFDSYDNENARLHRGVAGEGPAHTRGSSSREQTDKAIAFIARAQGANRRFFLWVHYYDPHFEYEPHPEVPSFGTAPIDLYDGEIRYTDLHVGRLFDDLRSRGLWDRTVVVITGDHGEGFGEHGVDLHGYHLYAAQTKVPLIVRVPGLAARRIATPAGHVDLLPTLANLAGAAPSSEMMGRSLLDVLAGGPEVDRVVFQQLSYEGNHEMRAAADRRCHVIYNVSPSTSWEMYRIDRDPTESRDVVDDPGPCTDTRRALETWYDQSRIPAGAGAALLPSAPAIAKPLDVDLGSEVRLLDVAVPAQARAGTTVDVTWTFAARGRLDGGWKVFAHFEDGHGHRFTGDHDPVRPIEWWRAGQFIRYTTPVAIPRGQAPGRYALWTGLWRGNQRRAARAPAVPVVDNRARVAEIEVVP